MGRPKAPCGTDAAYRRHLRNGEDVDAACRRAHTQAGRKTSRRPSMPVEDGPGELGAGTEPDEDVARGGESDDMQLILDTLRKAFKTVADEDPARIAPLAREFRTVVEAVRGPAEPPKELSLADQLAEARAARAARAAGQGASA